MFLLPFLIHISILCVFSKAYSISSLLSTAFQLATVNFLLQFVCIRRGHVMK